MGKLIAISMGLASISLSNIFNLHLTSFQLGIFYHIIIRILQQREYRVNKNSTKENKTWKKYKILSQAFVKCEESTFDYHINLLHRLSSNS